MSERRYDGGPAQEEGVSDEAEESAEGARTLDDNNTLTAKGYENALGNIDQFIETLDKEIANTKTAIDNASQEHEREALNRKLHTLESNYQSLKTAEGGLGRFRYW